MDRCRGRAAALAGALTLGAAARPAEAGVPDTYGFGSRSAAMAGAVTGDAADFSASFYNPAGLVEAPGIEIAAGYMYTAQRLYVGEADNDVAPVRGLVAGVVAPGVLLGLPFAFGVATHLPDHGLSYLKARREGVPRWELYDTRAQLLYLSANLAIRPPDWLEPRGRIGSLSATRGRFGITGRADVLSPYDSQLEHEVDADLTSIRFPQAGLRLLLERFGALGVTYRGESKLDLRLDARLEGIVDFAGIEVPMLYELEARTLSSFTPSQLALGLSFQGIEDLRLNLDLTWVQWSAYESPTAKIRARIAAEPPPGVPLDLPEEPAPTVPIPPELEDRWVPRVGVEYRLGLLGPERRRAGEADGRPALELPLRAGYEYERSPVPDQTGVTNLIDADRHTMTAGFGLVWNAPCKELGGAIELDLHAAYSILPERRTLKENAADLVGDYRASGHMVGLGAVLGVEL
ncbi:MAG: hypothetical protein HY744_12265 [Deltaproteobacteria bacterium]|nr:hypothetical protein [Deltaproteobacteria bacterium]